MKKLTLLTATALTLTCLGGQTLTVQAAAMNPQTVSKNLQTTSKNLQQISLNGNRVIVTYGYGCDIQDLLGNLENLQNRFPCISLPEINIPDVNIPGANRPETECPDINIPETDLPGSDKPETDLPETDNSDTNLPETDKPEADSPGTDKPGSNVPDSNDKPGDNNTEENIPETETPEDTTEHAYIRQVVNLVNAERAKEGLAPLTIDTKVQTAAQVRAIECEQSFSHTRPNGSSFTTALKEQNVSYRSAGENIAWGQRSPEEVMNAWMNSSGHRANIMNPNFTTIGVGYYQNANGTNYWCQLFTN